MVKLNITTLIRLKARRWAATGSREDFTQAIAGAINLLSRVIYWALEYKFPARQPE